MLEKVFLLMKVKGSIRIGAMPSFFLGFEIPERSLSEANPENRVSARITACSQIYWFSCRG